MSNLSRPRETALKALVKVEKDGAYLNIVMRDMLFSTDMDDRDRALATNLAYGVLKNKLYIDNIISHLSSVKLKKLSVWIHNILRIGIFSIKFLDRIPVSATVNECVRLARRYGHGASAGFVNALLRNADKKGDFLPNRENFKEYISIKYSMPSELVEKWLNEGYGEEFFSAMNEDPPLTVRLNTLKAESLSEKFTKSDFSPFSYTYIGSGSAEHTDEFINGYIAIQDGASQKAVLALDIKENMSVLDLCAAPGGKTGFIAQLLNNTGSVVSCDIHPHKLDLIKNNLKRLGVTNATVTLNDASVIRAEFVDRFDRVLCDVPCSGLGVLRRKPDIKWTKTEAGNMELVKIQRLILDCGARYVKKGGRLVYSTCTVNESENAENVRHFLESHSDFSVLPEGTYGKQLLPHTDGTDGFFYAVFERK